MIYLLVLLGLFVAELAYFRIADHFNIIDKPNERSSHSQITLRGGGVVFPLGVLAFYLLFGQQYPWFVLGLVMVALVSFADDVREQPTWLRFLMHVAAVLLMFWQTAVLLFPWYLAVLALLVVIAGMNAYNFMDGINGITALYSFTIIGALYLLNRQIQLFDNNLLVCLALANVVFSWFNCRAKPRAFAGDVGSVSMAYSLFFLTAWIVFHTGNPVFLLFFILYGIDTFNTIIERIRLGENIFQAHRRHLFQYLANEMRIPHLWVSALYMVLQALISLYVLWIWQMPAGRQLIMAAILIVPLELIYLLLKYRILPRYVAGQK